MPRPKGHRLSQETREAIGQSVRNTAIERHAAIREALDFRDHVMRAATETPDRPISEIVRLMPPSEDEQQE